MKSNAAINNHPIHPMLVPIPIGLIVWTLISHLIFILSDNQTWYDIAFWSGFAAWISALVAALPGLVDYLNVAVHSDSRNIATAHLLLNVTVVALFAVATALMWDDNATSGSSQVAAFLLHLIGNGLILVSGWLGGEMVYRHHLSMIPDDIDLERRERQRHFEPELEPQQREA